jgi:hypothetical protein
MCVTRLEDIDGTLNVYAGIMGRIGHRAADINLRGMVNDVLRTEARENLPDSGSIGNIRSKEPSLTVEVPLIPSRQVVDYRYLMARDQSRIHDVRTYETSASGHQNS